MSTLYNRFGAKVAHSQPVHNWPVRQWEITNFIHLLVTGKVVHIVFKEQNAAFKDYNLNRFYETKHAE